MESEPKPPEPRSAELTTYTRLGPNWVESSSGYSVRRVDRHTLRYSEQDRELDVEVEAGLALAVYAQSITSWRPPFEHISVSPQDRERIMQHILAALAFMGVPACAA